MVVGLHSARDAPGNSEEWGGMTEAGHLFMARSPKYPSACSPSPDQQASRKPSIRTQVQRTPNQLGWPLPRSPSAIQRDSESPWPSTRMRQQDPSLQPDLPASY